MNYRSTSLFSPLISTATLAVACLLVASLAGQPAGSPLTLLSRETRRTVPVALVGDQEFIALDDLAGAFQLAVREEAGAVTVSYRGRTVVLTPNQPLASVSGRLDLASRAVDPHWQSMDGAGRIHQPGACADLRHTPRSAAPVAARRHRGPSRAPDHRRRRQLGRCHAFHVRHQSGDSKRYLAGDGTAGDPFRSRCARHLAAAGNLARTRSGGARDRALVHHHRSGPAIRLVPRVDAGDWKHLAIDSRRARRGGRNLESARRLRQRRPSRRHRRNCRCSVSPQPFGQS